MLKGMFQYFKDMKPFSTERKESADETIRSVSAQMPAPASADGGNSDKRTRRGYPDPNVPLFLRKWAA